MNIKPTVKWAGGKTQLLDVLVPLVPRKYKKYYEPFLGGGAMLFELQPDEAVINDINVELITMYKIIKENPKKFMTELRKKVKEHNEHTPTSEYYLKQRSLNVDELNDTDIATRFIYLNKTGFNGLYRVNSKGEFNVPFNKKEEITISTLCNQANINRMSTYFNEQQVDIKNEDFESIINQAEEGDFIFVDSPYDDSFTGYSSSGFGENEHRRLAESLERASKRGVKWITTNHNTPLIQELYKNNYCFEVPVNRFINSNAQKRVNATTEVIIINYFEEIRSVNLEKFNEAKFFKELKPTSFVLSDYVKWEEIQKRVRANKLYINDLNLLHSRSEDEFKEKFNDLFEERAESFSILPLLLANRTQNYQYWLESGLTETFDWNSKEVTYNFLVDSGLMENLFLNSNYKSVFDYLLGLEVGLTSNDKKNLTGNWMASQVEMILEENGIEFDKEVSYEKIVKANRIKSKRFDYVFKIDEETYCVEVNFFNTTGSKINSEAGRFIDLDNTFRSYENIHFIWVTDGVGLRGAKSDIINAMRSISHLYNLTTFEQFIKDNK